MNDIAFRERTCKRDSHFNIVRSCGCDLSGTLHLIEIIFDRVFIAGETLAICVHHEEVMSGVGTCIIGKMFLKVIAYTKLNSVVQGGVRMVLYVLIVSGQKRCIIFDLIENINIFVIIKSVNSCTDICVGTCILRRIELNLQRLKVSGIKICINRRCSFHNYIFDYLCGSICIFNRKGTYSEAYKQHHSCKKNSCEFFHKNSPYNYFALLCIFQGTSVPCL